MNKKFPRQKLLDVLSRDAGEILKNDIYDRSRWTLRYYLVFRLDGKIWSIWYQRGATENQDESPWEYDGDEIECTEVEAVEVKTIEYRAVNP